jgi:cold shock CspA family protein
MVVDKHIGTIIFFNNKKGWGMLLSSDKVLFFHHSDIMSKKRFKTLKRAADVAFNIDSDTVGTATRAIQVEAL